MSKMYSDIKKIIYFFKLWTPPTKADGITIDSSRLARLLYRVGE